MNIVNKKTKDLIPYQRNAKKHSQTQIDNVAQSIKEFGIVQPIVIDKDNNIIIGHCRALACKKLGIEEVPVVKMEDLTAEEANKLRLLDNKLNESEWDFELLAEDIPELDFDGFEIDWGIIAPDDFGEDFSLPDGDKPEIGQITFTLHRNQIDLIEQALNVSKNEIKETFGNENKNGNALYEVVRQWAKQRRLL